MVNSGDTNLGFSNFSPNDYPSRQLAVNKANRMEYQKKKKVSIEKIPISVTTGIFAIYSVLHSNIMMCLQIQAIWKKFILEKKNIRFL